MGKHKITSEEVTAPAKKVKKDTTEPDSQGTPSLQEAGEEKGLSYYEKLAYASAISQPMAGKKLCKKLLKLIKKAHQHKDHLRSGLKDVQTRIRKGDRGIVVFAADVTPIDVMCHLPAVCEDKDIPYCYVPMRRDISNAMGVRRPTLMALVLSSGGHFSEYADLYAECEEAIKALPTPSLPA